MVAAMEACAHLPPALPVGTGEIAGVVAVELAGDGGHDPYRAAQHRRCRIGLPAGGPPLVAAIGPEQLLEIVVGARQIGDGITVEQTGAVAAGHFEEMVNRAGKAAGLGAVAHHGAEQAIKTASHRFGWLAGSVAQDPGGLVDPGIDTAKVRPERLHTLEPTREQLAQLVQRTAQPPLAATRSRLAATASSRSWSFSPEAANGGRPSSVMALRTAAQ